MACTAPPLNVVLRPGSPAEAAYDTRALAPGFEHDASLDLRFLGGRTIPRLTFANVHLGGWEPRQSQLLDAAIAAAMADRRLNNVLAQYFPGQTVGSRFAGSRTIPDVPESLDQGAVETLVERLVSEGVLAGLDRTSTALCLLLPPGTILRHGDVTSEHGLGGYHGSVHVHHGGAVYYAVAVYSAGGNGIVAFGEPWKNVCATLYHELQEVRTDPDVEDAIRGGTQSSERLLGWYSPRGGEIGDIPMAAARGDLSNVMVEVPLADGSGRVPVQLMWSNAVGGPEGPISRPHSPRSAAPRSLHVPS
jgi:hypothetical protein